MEDLNNIDLFTLVDMLAKHTDEFMKMLKNGSTTEEYKQCKTHVQHITAEIAYRKQKSIETGKKNALQDGKVNQPCAERFEDRL